MSCLRGLANRLKKDPPLLIVAGDLHLSDDPPASRSSDPDWIGTQRGYLQQLRRISDITYTPEGHDLDISGSIPVAYAGDIFDKPENSPELVNMVIECIPKGFSVAGQHDLPGHRLTDMKNSNYYTLVAAGKLHHLDASISIAPFTNGLRLCGFSWQQQIAQGISCAKNKKRDWKRVAIIHRHIYDTKEHTFPGCPTIYQTTSSATVKSLRGFDAAFFGDNHRGFIAPPHGKQKCWIGNCGTFMRRHANEYGYKPTVLIYHESGKITHHFLDTSKDIMLKKQATKILDEMDDAMDVAGLVDQLKRVGMNDIDFDAEARRWLERNKAGIRDYTLEFILQALERAKRSK